MIENDRETRCASPLWIRDEIRTDKVAHGKTLQRLWPIPGQGCAGATLPTLFIQALKKSRDCFLL